MDKRKKFILSTTADLSYLYLIYKLDLPVHTLFTHTVVPSVLVAQSAFIVQSITVTGGAAIRMIRNC